MDKTERPKDAAAMAADQIKKVADQAENMVTAASDQLRDVAGSAGEVAGNIKSAVDSSLKDQPMATLAVVAALGFVLGAIWKS